MKRFVLALLAAAGVALTGCEEPMQPTAGASRPAAAPAAPAPAAAKVVELVIAAEGADRRVEQVAGTPSVVSRTLTWPTDFSSCVAHRNAGQVYYLDHWFQCPSKVRLEVLTNAELERLPGVSIDAAGRTWYLLNIEPRPDFYVAVEATLGGDPEDNPPGSTSAIVTVVLWVETFDEAARTPEDNDRVRNTPAKAARLVQEHLTANAVRIRLVL